MLSSILVCCVNVHAKHHWPFHHFLKGQKKALKHAFKDQKKHIKKYLKHHSHASEINAPYAYPTPIHSMLEGPLVGSNSSLQPIPPPMITPPRIMQPPLAGYPVIAYPQPVNNHAGSPHPLTAEKFNTLKKLILIMSNYGVMTSKENIAMPAAASHLNNEAIHLLRQPKLQHIINLQTPYQQLGDQPMSIGDTETQRTLSELLENPTIKYFLDHPQQVGINQNDTVMP